ncbi:hypothetical protein M2421_001781 [Stenotrophomonas sp. BIGb0135]|nr:hypothetical protein [Stenotrophomonas sp. BIGb0135]
MEGVGACGGRFFCGQWLELEQKLEPKPKLGRRWGVGLGRRGWGAGTRRKYVHVGSYSAIHGAIRSLRPTPANP